MPDWKGLVTQLSGSTVTINDGTKTYTGLLESLNDDIARITIVAGVIVSYVYIQVAEIRTLQSDIQI